MNNYCMIQNSKTFAFSAENPTGVRAGGSQGGDCTKLRPTVTIPAGETVTLVDAAGPGVIQHMWFTGYVGHHLSSVCIGMIRNIRLWKLRSLHSSDVPMMKISWTGMANIRC